MRSWILGGLLLLPAIASCKRDDAHGAPPVTTGGRDPATPAVADAAPATASFDTLAVTIAGKPVAIGRALIKRLRVGGFQIYLANQGGSCRELLDNLFSGDDGQIDVLVDTAVRLAADGSQATIVSSLIPPHGPGDVDAGSKAVVTGTADAGAKVAVSLDVTGKTISGEPVVMHGTFTADGCGPQADDPSGVPRAPHPASATLTVAGRSFPLVGALRKGGDLYLSTGPRDCSPWTPRAEARLAFERGFWKLEGDWFAQEHSNAVSPDAAMRKVKIVAGATGTSPDGATVQLALSGAGTIEGYPVVIAGTIEALDCPAAK